ncbi:MAG: PspC domain-containing protein [Chloroflexi bacterium]|nr:PspC domain-containing protein [Chloroflexota bacterium]
MSATRLERSVDNRMVAGVCGGIAEYLQIDATIVRVFFVLLTIFGGVGLLAYIVLLVVMPLPGQGLIVGTSSSEASGDAAAATSTPRVQRRRESAGYILIAIGLAFLLNNIGALRFLDGRYLWPLALIAIGLLLLGQRLTSR